jgi:hypothetical protein
MGLLASDAWFSRVGDWTLTYHAARASAFTGRRALKDLWRNSATLAYTIWRGWAAFRPWLNTLETCCS